MISIVILEFFIVIIRRIINLIIKYIAIPYNRPSVLKNKVKIKANRSINVSVIIWITNIAFSLLFACNIATKRGLKYNNK